MNAAELWDRLRNAGLVHADVPAEGEETENASWPVRILLGIAGWIAALFLFAFFMIFIEDLWNSTAGLLILGLLLCAAAGWMFRAPQQAFMQQFALAVALAGQVLTWLGIYKLFGQRDVPAGIIVGLFELLLVWLLPNYLHRVLATIAAGCFFYSAAVRWGFPFAFDVLVAVLFSLLWLKESDSLVRRPALESVGIALGLLLAGASMGFLQFNAYLYHYDGSAALHFWVAQAAKLCMGLVFVLSVRELLRQAEVPHFSRMGLAALAAGIVLAILCIQAPGMLPALLLVLVAFGRGHRFMTLLGLLALVGYGFHYYYILDYTLLVKAGILAATGAALLLARLLLQRLGAAHA